MKSISYSGNQSLRVSGHQNNVNQFIGLSVDLGSGIYHVLKPRSAQERLPWLPLSVHAQRALNEPPTAPHPRQ